MYVADSSLDIRQAEAVGVGGDCLDGTRVALDGDHVRRVSCERDAEIAAARVEVGYP